MRPAQFDDIRRQLRISLLGQELTPAQADQLKEMVNERIDPGLHVKMDNLTKAVEDYHRSVPGAYQITIPWSETP